MTGTAADDDEVPARMLSRSEQERAWLLKQATREAMREVLKENSEETKRLIRESINAWLNEQFARFGRWSFYGIAALALAVIVYFALVKAGWTPPR